MAETLLLDTYLKQLRLPTFVRQHRVVAEDATRNHHDYEHDLLALAELEAALGDKNLQKHVASGPPTCPCSKTWPISTSVA